MLKLFRMAALALPLLFAAPALAATSGLPAASALSDTDLVDVVQGTPCPQSPPGTGCHDKKATGAQIKTYIQSASGLSQPSWFGSVCAGSDDSTNIGSAVSTGKLVFFAAASAVTCKTTLQIDVNQNWIQSRTTVKAQSGLTGYVLSFNGGSQTLMGVNVDCDRLSGVSGVRQNGAANTYVGNLTIKHCDSVGMEISQPGVIGGNLQVAEYDSAVGVLDADFHSIGVDVDTADATIEDIHAHHNMINLQFNCNSGTIIVDNYHTYGGRAGGPPRVDPIGLNVKPCAGGGSQINNMYVDNQKIIIGQDNISLNMPMMLIDLTKVTLSNNSVVEINPNGSRGTPQRLDIRAHAAQLPAGIASANIDDSPNVIAGVPCVGNSDGTATCTITYTDLVPEPTINGYGTVSGAGALTATKKPIMAHTPTTFTIQVDSGTPGGSATGSVHWTYRDDWSWVKTFLQGYGQGHNDLFAPVQIHVVTYPDGPASIDVVPGSLTGKHVTQFSATLESDFNWLTRLLRYTDIDGAVHTIQMAQWQWLASPYTLTSTTAAQPMLNGTTNGRLTVATGLYSYRCRATATGLSASSGNVSFTWGGSATYTSTINGSLTKSAGFANITPAEHFSSSGTITTTANTNTNMYLRISGLIRVTGVGNIQPQIALGVAAAAVIGADSGCEVMRQDGTAAAPSGGNWD